MLSWAQEKLKAQVCAHHEIVGARIAAEVATVREEYTHRLAQAAGESKRLNAQLLKAQSDITRLTRALDAVLARVGGLEVEVGVD
jgi:hypothetical protein